MYALSQINYRQQANNKKPGKRHFGKFELGYALGLVYDEPHHVSKYSDVSDCHYL